MSQLQLCERENTGTYISVEDAFPKEEKGCLIPEKF